MSNICAISLNGVMNAEQSFDGAARRIANTNLGSPNNSGDLATDLVDLKQAEIAGKANLRAISSQDELEKDALNLFA
jgi:hypothetical protein